ncbi:hypothetical protein FALBO_11277, partial [Fusarium albosuccineum]
MFNHQSRNGAAAGQRAAKYWYLCLGQEPHTALEPSANSRRDREQRCSYRRREIRGTLNDDAVGWPMLAISDVLDLQQCDRHQSIAARSRAQDSWEKSGDGDILRIRLACSPCECDAAAAAAAAVPLSPTFDTSKEKEGQQGFRSSVASRNAGRAPQPGTLEERYHPEAECSGSDTRRQRTSISKERYLRPSRCATGKQVQCVQGDLLPVRASVDVDAFNWAAWPLVQFAQVPLSH